MTQKVILPRNYSLNLRYPSGNKIFQIRTKSVESNGEIINVKIGKNRGKRIEFEDGKNVLVITNKKIKSLRPNILYSADLIIPSTKEELATNHKIHWIRPRLTSNSIEDVSSLKLRCESARNSWKNKFEFSEEEKISESEIHKGFRSAQIGALHAVLAHWKVSNKPATIVMPTGTGKTETMLALLAHQRLERVLVVVPSDALRTQISNKFIELGLLQDLNMLIGSVEYPVVGILKHRPRSSEEIENFFNSCNVVVSTINVLSGLSDSLQEKVSQLCTHLFIDEAHHIPAPTWEKFRSHFKNKLIVQFTATPFRSDGRHIDGKIIYNFPLAKAQEEGYFKQINFLALRIYNQTLVDEEIASKAITQLNQDLSANFNHVIMARAENTDHADEIFEIYKRLAPNYNPVIIHNKIKKGEQKSSIEKVKNGQSRIVVCVDMFGEGYDFPEFKIAAMHDIHKSLAITLQFTGRFVRSRNDIGNATIIANVAKRKTEDALKELFAEDSDWNKILRTLSEGRTGQEERKSEFFEGFVNPPDDMPVESILPKMSTVVYKTSCPMWHPEKVTDVIKTSKIYAGPTVNNQFNVTYFVTNELENLEWTRIKEITNVVWNLYLLHWDTANNLLYINSTNNKGHHEGLAKAVCGDTVELVTGEKIFRTLKGINRLILMNLGLKHVFGKAVRFTMHAGMDVSGGIADITVQNKIKSNLFGRGFEHGNKSSIGCSYKGRVWAYKVADSVGEWVEWCHEVGSKLQDTSVDPDAILKNALVPEEVKDRPSLYPLSIDWSEEVFLNFEDAIRFDFSGEVVPFFEASINLVDRSNSGPIVFEIKSENKASKFKIEFNDNGPNYSIMPGNEEIKVLIRGKSFLMEEWLIAQPPTILFEDSSMLSGGQLFKYKNASVAPYDKTKISVWNWSGVNLSRESQTSARLSDSIQYKVIQELLSSNISYDLVFDDDGSGEVADVVAFKISDDRLLINIFHCKYSQEETPGARVNDLYEVCGQSQKSVNWKCDIEKMIRHLRNREIKRISNHETSRFQKGNMTLLDEIEAKSPTLIPEFNVHIVQPGLSVASVSDDQLKLIACTELYLQDTYAVKLEVIANN